MQRMLNWFVRITLAILAGSAALVYAGGYFAYHWAAWAPPGTDNPDYERLLFTARYNGALAFCFFVISLLAIFLRIPTRRR